MFIMLSSSDKSERKLPSEVRCLVFSREELKEVVSNFLSRRGKTTQRYEIANIFFDKKPEFSVHIIKDVSKKEENLILSTEDMLSAILLYCAINRIPLAYRAQKRIFIKDDVVFLEMILGYMNNSN